ncbi:DUF5063 domain-containing protein [Thiocapsa imhoffii]|uniref:DUF5063 domain-containing protein n=1 Tax=Thiocapsa imhoffii TaxID=382777 RepID=UPI001F5B5B29|nr:DUF5063 domain-containing protein [Thiocapsa imhoffii]
MGHSPALEVAALAQRYCELIEGAAATHFGWLRAVARILPRLHAAIHSVEPSRRALLQGHRADLDERFELYSRLRALLADRDAYWLEFDQVSDDAMEMTGSLADDLTDIYCELQAGLVLYGWSPESALATWSRGFEWHWGRHLIDAERHLALLASQGRLDP